MRIQFCMVMQSLSMRFYADFQMQSTRHHAKLLMPSMRYYAEIVQMKCVLKGTVNEEVA